MLWVKAGHILAVISWMAALLYLPRLLVYHCDADVGSVQSETFKVMERRLLKAIATPAMIASWVFGLWLALLISAWSDVWFLLKLVLVSGLTVFHFFLTGCVKTFDADCNDRSARFYRIVNEVPTLLMIGIVVLVVVKPF